MLIYTTHLNKKGRSKKYTFLKCSTLSAVSIRDQLVGILSGQCKVNGGFPCGLCAGDKAGWAAGRCLITSGKKTTDWV